MSEKTKCPKCGSDQITADKKGFSGKKAVAGAVLTGGIGLLAGTIGSNKIQIYCLNCGNSWLPSENHKKVELNAAELKAAKKTAFLTVYTSGQLEKAKEIYRDVHSLPADNTVTDLQLKEFADSAKTDVNMGYVIIVFFLLIIIFVVYKFFA